MPAAALARRLRHAAGCRPSPLVLSPVCVPATTSDHQRSQDNTTSGKTDGAGGSEMPTSGALPASAEAEG